MARMLTAAILGFSLFGSGVAVAEDCGAHCDYWHNYGPYDYSYIQPGLLGYPISTGRETARRISPTLSGPPPWPDHDPPGDTAAGAITLLLGHDVVELAVVELQAAFLGEGDDVGIGVPPADVLVRIGLARVELLGGIVVDAGDGRIRIASLRARSSVLRHVAGLNPSMT